MSHEFYELDNAMMGSGEPGWHGLGTVIAGQPDSATAIATAGLDWGTELVPLHLPDGRGGLLQVPNAFCIVRDDLDPWDTRRILSSAVSEKYKLIRNGECFSICDYFAGEGGARFETAGSLKNGSLVWMLCVLPKVSKIGDDNVARYLLLTTAHTGKEALKIMFTPIRVVCWNTLRWAVLEAEHQISIPHLGDTRAKIVAAKKAIETGKLYFEKHEAQARKMAQEKLDDRFAAAYVQALFPDSDPETGQIHKQNPKRRERILELYDGAQAGGDQDATKGTAYGLLNAVSQWVEHEKPVVTFKGNDARESRFSSSLLKSGHHFVNRAANLLCNALDLEGTAKAVDDDQAKAVDDLLAQIDLN